MDLFTLYVILGVLGGVATVYKIHATIKHPARGIPFEVVLNLVPRRSKKVLLSFVFLLVMFAWAPLAIGYIYKELPRLCERVAAIVFVFTVFFFVVFPAIKLAAYDAGSYTGPLEYTEPLSLWPWIVGIAVILLIIYIKARPFKSNEPEPPAPEERSP